MVNIPPKTMVMTGGWSHQTTQPSDPTRCRTKRPGNDHFPTKKRGVSHKGHPKNWMVHGKSNKNMGEPWG